jgi:hypothetical protein
MLDIYYLGKVLHSSHVVIGFALFMTSIIWNNDTILVDAQTTSLPLPSRSPSIVPPSIQITSHQDGQQVPAGELTIEGISSDDKKTDCQVYADVDDNTPMRNVTADSRSGKNNDFSKWTFTYMEQYRLINEGENELTAKISCFGVSSSPSIPLSEWHTINVTGIPTMAGHSFIAPPSFLSPLPSTEDFQIDDDGQEEEGEDSEGDQVGGSDEDEDGDENEDPASSLD